MLLTPARGVYGPLVSARQQLQDPREDVLGQVSPPSSLPTCFIHPFHCDMGLTVQMLLDCLGPETQSIRNAGFWRMSLTPPALPALLTRSTTYADALGSDSRCARFTLQEKRTPCERSRGEEAARTYGHTVVGAPCRHKSIGFSRTDGVGRTFHEVPRSSENGRSHPGPPSSRILSCA